MPKTCDFRDPGAKKICGLQATWVADVGWIHEPDVASAYTGTSWNMSLCERHYEELLATGRITGTAHRVPDPTA